MTDENSAIGPYEQKLFEQPQREFFFVIFVFFTVRLLWLHLCCGGTRFHCVIYTVYYILKGGDSGGREKISGREKITRI